MFCSLFFLCLPPPSPDPCCVSSNYQSTEKTLSFKGLAIISVEHNKMASPQEEGEVWAVVRRCMSHRLALEVGAEVEVLKKVYFFFFFFPVLFFSPSSAPAWIFDNQRASWETTWVKWWGFIARDLFLLFVRSLLLKYECRLNWKRLK